MPSVSVPLHTPMFSVPSLKASVTGLNDYTIQASNKRMTISFTSNSITIFVSSSSGSVSIASNHLPSILHTTSHTYNSLDYLLSSAQLVCAAIVHSTISSISPFILDNHST
ncbi:hypothetical protein NXS19_012315 [Fusarium pseudograminearum]|nr:hypothetical protein NXS19_012315 [Fusarium pseudograminearum]